MQRGCHDPPLERSKKSLQAHAKMEKISWAVLVEASSRRQESAQARQGVNQGAGGVATVNLPAPSSLSRGRGGRDGSQGLGTKVAG